MAISYGAIRRLSTSAVRTFIRRQTGEYETTRRGDRLADQRVRRMSPCEKCFALLSRRPCLDRLGIDRAPAAVVLTLPAAGDGQTPLHEHVVQHSVTGPERDRIHGVRGSASQIWGVQDTLQ